MAAAASPLAGRIWVDPAREAFATRPTRTNERGRDIGRRTFEPPKVAREEVPE